MNIKSKGIDRLIMVFMTIITCLLVVSFILNLCRNKIDTYFDARFSEVLNIAVTGMLVLLISQINNKSRKKAKIANWIICKVLDDIMATSMYDVKGSDDIVHIRLVQRTTFNRLKLLKEYEDDLGYKTELKNATDEFHEYWDTVSSHIQKLEELQTVKTDLNRQLLLVSDKLEKMLVAISKV